MKIYRGSLLWSVVKKRMKSKKFIFLATLGPNIRSTMLQLSLNYSELFFFSELEMTFLSFAELKAMKTETFEEVT